MLKRVIHFFIEKSELPTYQHGTRKEGLQYKLLVVDVYNEEIIASPIHLVFKLISIFSWEMRDCDSYFGHSHLQKRKNMGELHIMKVGVLGIKCSNKLYDTWFGRCFYYLYASLPN